MQVKTDSIRIPIISTNQKKNILKLRTKLFKALSLKKKHHTERKNKLKLKSSSKDFHYKDNFEEKKRIHKTLMENLKLPTLKINLKSISFLNKINSKEKPNDLILYKILKSKITLQKEKKTKVEEEKKKMPKFFKLVNKVNFYKKLLLSLKISTNIINLENKISSREKSSLISKKEKNNIILYIFGGQGSEIFEDLYKIDIKKKTKKKIKLQNNMNKSIERYGHTSHLYKKNSILIIGGFGYKKKNHYKFFYDTKNFFYQIDLLKNRIEENVCRSIKYPIPRIHHDSVNLEDKFLFVFGGEDREGNILNCLWIFCFEFRIWLELKIDFGNVFFKNGICKHRMACVSDEFILKNYLREWKNTEFEDDRDLNLKTKKNKTIGIVNIYQKMKNKIYKPKCLNDGMFLDIKNNILLQKQLKSKIIKNKKRRRIENFQKYKKNKENKENKEIIDQNITKKKYEIFKTVKENEIFSNFLSIFTKKMIFLYGGINSKIENDKNLRIFQFDEKTKKFYFKIIKAKGKIPNSRFNHTMNYFSKLKLLIIYGGKNKFNENIKYLSVFSLLSKKWSKILILSNLKVSRINHCTTFQDDHFFVFGGTGFGGYVFENLYHNKIVFDEFL